MALFTSTLLAQVSGKLGGTVFSHNRGGKYIRSAATPTDPNTVFQQVVRANMATLVATWPTITDKDREAWATYAANVPLPDRFGEPRSITGQQMFIRCNAARLQAGLSIIDAGPTAMFLEKYSFGFVRGIAATDKLRVTFDTTDDWVTEDGAGLLVWSSRDFGHTINFFKGPYRFAGIILGDSAVPPTSPDESITSPFVLAVGRQIGARSIVVGSDGRISTTQFHGPLQHI